MRLRRWIASAMVVAALAVPAGAGANHALIEFATVNPLPAGSAGTGYLSSTPFIRTPTSVSPDGSRIYFVTAEALAPQDTDGSVPDLYERSGTGFTLVSTGPGPDGGASGTSVGTVQTFFFSPDGTRAFFSTAQRLAAEDTDAHEDLYEWSGGAASLVTAGTAGLADISKTQTSADGSRVFFETTEQLTPSDTDLGTDIYERAGGQTTLVTTGTPGSVFMPGVTPPQPPQAVSADGSRVLFRTADAVAPEDIDGQYDVYLWDEGTITLASTGPADAHASGLGAANARISPDGERIIFDTNAALVTSDANTVRDVYERSNGTTTLRSSPGPGGANGEWFAGMSEDGSRVFFTSTEQLTSADTDLGDDLYENANGTMTLLSTGPASSCGGGSCGAVELHAATPDGSYVVFRTTERLVTRDNDDCFDIYKRGNGVTELVSTGPANGDHCQDYNVKHISDDGGRVIFDHKAGFVREDTDAGKCTFWDDDDQVLLRFPCYDTYERYAGETTMLSVGPIGGHGGFDALFRGASDDGSVVAFDTQEPLFLSDNSANDMFVRRVGSGHVRPKSASPVRVSLVPAYIACTAPNRTHGPPLAYASCGPPTSHSSLLTAGTGDGSPALARSVGYARMAAIVGMPGAPDDSDMRLQLKITNVMLSSDLSDYTGELRGEVGLRITDKDNGAGEQGTVSDVPFRFTVPCAATSSTSDGGTCNLQTTAEAVIPGMIVEGKRAVFQFGQVRAFDGGPDNDGDTEGDNSPFAVQGIFVP